MKRLLLLVALTTAGVALPDPPTANAATEATIRVSVASDGTEGNGWTGYRPSISADGNLVAFLSTSSNLVAGDTNGAGDYHLSLSESSSLHTNCPTIMI